MYLKCFFVLNGHLTTRTVVSPVSQTNVTGHEGVGVVGYVRAVHARYKQATRHMWGSLDSGYGLIKVAEIWRRRKHSLCMWRPLHLSTQNNVDACVPDVLVDALMEKQMESGDFTHSINITL